MRCHKSYLTYVIALIVPGISNASGIFLGEAGYANLGTAGAGDGVYTNSPAAIWTNPATASFMDEEKHTISGTVLNLNMAYEDDRSIAGSDAESNKTMPIVSYFSNHHLSDSWSLGLAFSSRGGAALDYGYDWQGANQLTDVALVTYQFNPSVSYRIDDRAAIAFGVQLDYALINANTQSIELATSDSFAAGFNLGMMFDVTERVNLGIAYRSKLEHDFEGDSKVISGSNVIASGSYGAPLITPAMLDISASYKLSPQTSLFTSVQWHDWSKWQQTVVDLSFTQNPYVINREFDDVWHFGFGAQHRLNNSSWTLKAGYSYETSPLDDSANQSPDLPVGEQHRYSIGLSKDFKTSTLDLYYQYADFGEMDVDQQSIRADAGLQGSFIGQVHFVGASYTF
ncbi:OmpP1/FadL family transporter [Vibrio gallicus]|uniref:OmpP1/FadL family transporter n=1 Tax=Vibrio gallicus TaxID=190897 RepID=UPI0021C30E3F|nr:outer membrane protein transport protein [Vibrio gallicus]